MRKALKNISDKLWNTSGTCKFETILNRSEKPFEHTPANFTDAEITKSYTYDNKHWYHVEHVYKLQEPVLVEPDYGYAICGFNTIVPQSKSTNTPLPSFPRYIKSLFKPKPHYAKAILFDISWGVNYFHFFSDVINKIWLLQQTVNGGQVPFIISRRIYNTPYFQHLLQHAPLKQYTWIIQEPGDYIKVDELYLAHPMPYQKEYYDKLRGLLDIHSKPNNNRRVFLTRSKQAGRYIQNFDEIQPILNKYGFEVIDTAGATLKSQIETFGSIKHLISIHGAGNTNIIFADPSLHFLEINPDDRISCHYYWLATTLGIAYYNAVLGSKLSADKCFRVEPEVLESAIQQLLNT